MHNYNPKQIEQKWQSFWEKNKTFETPKDVTKENKSYVLPQLPYPSGSGLHVGHAEVYIGSDVFARFERMKGKKVLQVVGWDSFGLPAENHAIKTNVHPQKSTDDAINNFRSQIKLLGISADWDREVGSHNADYYKWTQWFFLLMYKRGLAYRKTQPVNWCDSCKTVLANEQVEAGNCERCGTVIIQKEMEQWYLKITDYADRLLEGLDKIDWPEETKKRQKDWIGRSEGAELDFAISDSLKGKKILCLHAYKDDSKSSFWPWLIPQLNNAGAKSVTILDLPNSNKPNIQEQIKFVDDNYTLDENTVVITHSLGGVLAMKLLEKSEITIDSLIMVAPPLNTNLKDKIQRPDLDNCCDWKFNFENIKQKARTIKVLADKNDHLVFEKDTKFIADQLNAQYILKEGDKPHFNGREEKNVLNLITKKIRVFTTRPDTLFGATYMVLAPEHKLVHELEDQITNLDEVKKYILETSKKTDLDRQINQEKTGVKLEGVKAINPATNQEIDVWIADYVLASYGFGAIMAVPAHDERDFEFANKFGLEIKEVIAKKIGNELENFVLRKSVRAICIKDGKFLSTFDKKTEDYLLVGGGIDEGESPEEAILREIKEESGYVNAKIISSLGVIEHNYPYPSGEKNCKSHVSCFVVEILDGEIQKRSQEEIDKTDIFWVSKEDLIKNVSSNTRTVVREKVFLDRYFGNVSLCSFDHGVAINSEFLNDLDKDQAINKIITWLEENNIGRKKVQYKLRDWSVSRQRFWGAPIPMLYDDKGELHPVDEKDLPVMLPNDVDFKPTGESPLNYSVSFAKGVEEKYGKGWKREPDTLDTFMCSSWYFFRYLDPKNDSAFASPEALKTWMPVDYYLGGPEHVNGHLLYSRFFTKVLFDEGLIDFDEPFIKHRHQGLILGPDNRKMSKRWGNVVNPTDVVNEFGSDTLRTYQMFMGPLEDSKPWDTNGVKGVRRFLDRAWRLQEKLDSNAESQELLINKTIKLVTIDINNSQYNTAISKLMEFVNDMTKQDVINKQDYSKFILMLSIFAPHLSEEIWKEVLGHDKTIAFEAWPEFDESKIKEDTITLAIQVNGKVRATIEVFAEISEPEAKDKALNDERITKWLEDKEPQKVIYVKGKLVSIVV